MLIFKRTDFFHSVPKGEMHVTSHNPLLGSVVYRRTMIAAFLYSLQYMWLYSILCFKHF